MPANRRHAHSPIIAHHSTLPEWQHVSHFRFPPKFAFRGGIQLEACKCPRFDFPFETSIKKPVPCFPRSEKYEPYVISQCVSQSDATHHAVGQVYTSVFHARWYVLSVLEHSKEITNCYVRSWQSVFSPKSYLMRGTGALEFLL
ncbi:hypothetical protein JTE90_016525 [Oedothorax gibbosus]|uniref:Uncharacterized protein n=1 Tax=Oedothorax gibbosus TaxID=931172 RepID=A0AAV6TKK5_9ARAC|nr:hypothetical protein JTE90_016525 [Oedothorax gibbosus]